MMNTIATYNENNNTCVKHGHLNKSNVDSQSWLCRLNMTNQSTMGTKNAQNEKVTYKANKGCPLMDMVVSKYEPSQHIGLSLRIASPWYLYPLLELTTIHNTFIQSLGLLVRISKWIKLLVGAVLDMSIWMLLKGLGPMKFTSPLHASHWFVWIPVAKHLSNTNLICMCNINHESTEWYVINTMNFHKLYYAKPQQTLAIRILWLHVTNGDCHYPSEI